MARGRKPWNPRESTSKVCKWCEQEFIRPRRMGDVQWEKAQYCCRSCGSSGAVKKMTKAEFEAAIPESKICEICSTNITRREYETIHNWRKRRTCGRGCAGRFKLGKPQAPKTKKATPAEAAGVTIIKPGSERFEELRKYYESNHNRRGNVLVPRVYAQ